MYYLTFKYVILLQKYIDGLTRTGYIKRILYNAQIPNVFSRAKAVYCWKMSEKNPFHLNVFCVRSEITKLLKCADDTVVPQCDTPWK